MTTSRIRGTILLGLLRSSREEERETGRDVVRESIARHGSTVLAAAELDVSARTIQRVCKEAETCGANLRESARGRGRPRKPRPVEDQA